jgi:hypothetical protein
MCRDGTFFSSSPLILTSSNLSAPAFVATHTQQFRIDPLPGQLAPEIQDSRYRHFHSSRGCDGPRRPAGAASIPEPPRLPAPTKPLEPARTKRKNGPHMPGWAGVTHTEPAVGSRPGAGQEPPYARWAPLPEAVDQAATRPRAEHHAAGARQAVGCESRTAGATMHCANTPSRNSVSIGVGVTLAPHALHHENLQGGKS